MTRARLSAEIVDRSTGAKLVMLEDGRTGYGVLACFDPLWPVLKMSAA
jgi:hypothetical protein